MTATHKVLQTRILNASAQGVWEAWTDPDLMKQWFCPLGMRAIEVEVDLRIDGKFRIVMDPSDSAMRPPPEMGDVLTAYGTYERIYPPHELVFSWAWLGREEDSRVSISLTAKGDKTVIVLEHEGLKNESSQIFHEDGWVPTLENLSQHLIARRAWSTSP